uniref:Uncharacterized protein n=1 Tax=Nelumbo nucifera TaxID=4432 RepID=A0A822Z7H0_NELNU|nr:TPA_asm: hypothetical protein HUJ06_013673 [Nelumbo nucifera]
MNTMNYASNNPIAPTRNPHHCGVLQNLDFGFLRRFHSTYLSLPKKSRQPSLIPFPTVSLLSNVIYSSTLG